MIKFAKDNLKIQIETESVGDGVRFYITIPSTAHEDVTEAFRSAGFKIDNYDTYRKDIRFTCTPIDSYEEAENTYSAFIDSLGKSGFKVVKQKNERYTKDEILKMFA